MKPSYYNFIYKELLDNNDKIIIYNSRTGALSLLSPDNYKQYCDLVNSNIEITDKEFEKNLKDCGYIIDDTIDEKQLIRINTFRSRFNNSVGMITIAPTMSCNFRCVYCFEKNEEYKEGAMSNTTADNIVSYIKERATSLTSLSVTWYGGEPLMALDKIVYISKQILDICKESNIDYKASVVTNGYNINEEIVQTLLQCSINIVQITLDGPKEIHNKRRPLANGEGTFDTIISNIEKIKDLIDVHIRINIDYENQNRLNEIVDVLREKSLIDSVTLYLGLVVSPNDNYETNKCISDEMYSKLNLKFMTDNNIPVLYIYPRPKGNYCCADSCYGVVFDSSGNMYKCWSDIGIKERAIGNINNEPVTPNINLINSYLFFDPTVDDKCSDCKYLPVCLGGCPRNRLSKLDICETYRYNLDAYMKECTQYILNQKKEVK